ncbi:hypothetical protein V8E36_007048 [Tilletia maclaganii]
MPKSAKHKAQRAVDFQKTKLKLGSGKGKKATAKTATDTSFKARTIALPQQTITADKSQAIVTRRNLTLDDLLGQTRHYNGSTRKDALFGLRELLSAHPFLLHKPGILPSVLSASLRLIPDEDPSVRRAVHTFLSFLLPALVEESTTVGDGDAAKQQPQHGASPAALAHYAPSLILYTISALSHIFTEVRIDALRILDLLLDYIPTAVVGDWNGFAHAARLGPASGSEAQGSSTRTSTAGSKGQQVITCILTILGIPDLATFVQLQSGTQRAGSALSGMSTATANLPATARLLLFRVIGKFLDASNQRVASQNVEDTAHQDLRCPTWFMQSAFEQHADREAFERFLRFGPPGRTTGLGAVEDAEEDFWPLASAQYIQPGDSVADSSTSSGPVPWNANDLHTVLAATSDLIAACEDEALAAGVQSSVQNKARQAHSTSSLSQYSALASALAPVFLNSLLDSMPSFFTPDSVLTGLAMPTAPNNNVASTGLGLHGLLILAVIKATLKLWRSLASALAESSSSSLSSTSQRKLGSGQLNDLRVFLSKLAPYFPFSEHVPGASSRTPAEAQQLGEMDLMYAELVALCMFCTTAVEDGSLGQSRGAGGGGGGKGKRKATAQEMVLHQLEDVGEYIVQTLLGQRRAGAADGGGGGAMLGNTLAPATFAELLPTIWLLLNLDVVRKVDAEESDSEDEDSEDAGRDEAAQLHTRLVEAMIAYFGKTSRGKSLVFEFIARLTILHTFPSYSAHFMPLQHPEILKALRQWFHTLPRVLWDAGTKKDTHLANAILEYLRMTCAADDGEIFSHEDVDALHAPLAVFFHLQHPTRGPVAGPYGRMSAEAQARARALLFYLQPLDAKLGAAAAQAGVQLVQA